MRLCLPLKMPNILWYEGGREKLKVHNIQVSYGARIVPGRGRTIFFKIYYACRFLFYSIHYLGSCNGCSESRSRFRVHTQLNGVVFFISHHVFPSKLNVFGNCRWCRACGKRCNTFSDTRSTTCIKFFISQLNSMHF